MYSPPDVSEPGVQIAGSARKGVRNQAVEAVEAVYQELPLCIALRQHVTLIGEDYIQHLLKLILVKKIK